MKGSIKPIERGRVEDRRESILSSAWIKASQSCEPPANLSWLRFNQPTTWALDAGGQPALVLLGGGSSPKSPPWEDLLCFAEKEQRVYVIVGPKWSKDMDLIAGLREYPWVLLRKISHCSTSAVLFGQEGYLNFSNSMAGPAPWTLRLSPAQVEAMRHTFLRLFWHETEEEAWSGGKSLVWRLPLERPFDIPLPVRSAPVRMREELSFFDEVTGNALIHNANSDAEQVGGDIWSGAHVLWSRPSADGHTALAKLAAKGTRVSWSDWDLPDAVLTDDRSELLLSGEQNRLRVTLTNEQAAEVRSLLKAETDWQFQIDVVIGNTNHEHASFLIAGEPAPRPLVKEQVINLGELTAETLKSVDETAPDSLPDPDLLALSVKYKWTVRPPLLPAGAREDPLVEQWRKVDEEWEKRLAALRKTFDEADKNREGIRKRFVRFVGECMGFQRRFDELYKKWESLMKQTPSNWDHADARGLFNDLVELEGSAALHHKDVEDTDRKAHEDEERERQQNEFNKSQQNVKERLPSANKELDDIKQELARISDELDGLSHKRKDASKQEKEDIHAKECALKDGKSRLGKNFAAREQEIEALKRVLNSTFEFKAPKPSSSLGVNRNPFVKQDKSPRPTPQIPKEHLPAVGELSIHGKQRFLAISDWQDLAKGEMDAQRLKAKLVAAREKL